MSLWNYRNCAKGETLPRNTDTLRRIRTDARDMELAVTRRLEAVLVGSRLASAGLVWWMLRSAAGYLATRQPRCARSRFSLRTNHFYYHLTTVQMTMDAYGPKTSELVVRQR